MSEKLKQLAIDKCGNYILPFLWIHGEDEKELRTEVKKIYECGIKAFCVESRPHPDFVGEKWWRDMDILIDEAKKYGMKIWILDDSHFPTGTAAGQAALCEPLSRKAVLGYRWIDVCGALSGASFIPPYEVDLSEIKYIIAGRIDGHCEFIDITDRFINGRLYFDVPDGVWRIYYYYINSNCIHSPHINHLQPSGAKVLLNAVYEPHFERYKNEFGKTISGFFSDEPGFYACEKDFASYERKLGNEHISLNWDTDMERWLSESIGKPICEILPALSDNNILTEGERAYFRYTYMDILTKRYDACFCSILGNWCREHGVEYMGHITEDNNTHCRTAVSAGHFFRSMNGQDYSGADVVFHQILPGMEDINHAAFTGFYANSLADGEFYSYSLYQMVTSLAHIDEKKRGRSMCELFGAYGWGAGCKMMKWIADFMLVRGINHFVPHAFSAKEFPDDDCPPHFYAHGKNPQFEGFKHLMLYINRTAHLLNNGHHAADIAILYEGDNEWCSDDIIRSQSIGRLLAKAHLQYDIIPFDSLEKANVFDDQIILGTQRYVVLICPYSKYITEKNELLLAKFAKAGICVIFTDKLPRFFLESSKEYVPSAPDFFKTVALHKIVSICKKYCKKYISISAEQNSDCLRTYVYKHHDCTVFMLTNSHPSTILSADIELFSNGTAYEYDAYFGKIYSSEKVFSLELQPYESRLYVVTEAPIHNVKTRIVPRKKISLNKAMWTISTCTEEQYPDFVFYEKSTNLKNYNTPDRLPCFSGIIRYETEFVSEEAKSGMISVSGISESVQVFVNGQNAGMCIAPPYQLPIILCEGKNKIVIEVRNTLYNQINDIFSRYLPIEQTGITGDVMIML